MLFSPPVTTQFISNLERGVTPLPLNHVSTLTKALSIDESEMLSLLEREYTLKVSGRLSKMDGLNHSGSNTHEEFPVAIEDGPFMRLLYDAYQRADSKTKQTFHSICETILALRK